MQKFEEGEDVQYDHPTYGKGKGIVAIPTKDGKEYVILPKKKIKGCDSFLCRPEMLISTPF